MNFIHKKQNKFKKGLAGIAKLPRRYKLAILLGSLAFFSMALIVNKYLFTYAAGYSWVQTSWTASTTNAASHPGDQSGWTQYFSKTSVDTTNNELKLDRYSN
jgi:hypothetical protein